MGWSSYLEDSIKRLESNIHLAQTTFECVAELGAHQKVAGLRALAEARAILAQAWTHLDLATSPELDMAHDLLDAKLKIQSLDGAVRAEQLEARKHEREAAEYYASLVDANAEIKQLRIKLKNSEKLVEKLLSGNFDSAVDAFTSDRRILKHKPGEM